MKNIIICSDGTGNAGGQGSSTNVWRLYTALDLTSEADGKRQVAIHDDGVGTEDLKALKLFGGAFGFGLKRNVRELYRFLIRNYEPDQKDQIYIFGFSRGAYTARMLAGLISLCGIIDPKNKDDETINRLIYQAFSILRKTFIEESDSSDMIKSAWVKINDVNRHHHMLSGEKNDKAEPQSNSDNSPDNLTHAQELAKDFSEKYCHQNQNNAADGKTPYLIRFVGVWDTVPAYGFPIQELADAWNKTIFPFKFNDRSLSPCIRKAAHALAIDDARKTFKPMLFEHDPDRIDQVWFAGMHSNIGGGYPKDGLAYISLDWMMSKASQRIDDIDGLHFIDEKRNEIAKRINPYAKMYNSRAGLGVFYRYAPRDIHKLSKHSNIVMNEEEGPIIHPSVIQRIQARTEVYAPGNLPKEIQLSDKSNTVAVNLMTRFKSNFDSGRLLQGKAGSIKIRQYLHLSKIVIPVGMILLAKYFCEHNTSGKSDFGFFERLLEKVFNVIPFGSSIFENLLQPVLDCEWVIYSALGLLGITWLAGKLIKTKMRKEYSRFWSDTINKTD